MKTKLLLLFCSFSLMEGGAVANDIYLKRSGVEANPMGIPIFPPSEKCAIFSNILNISLDKSEDYAIITVMNKRTGEIVHSKTYFNTKYVTIDLSSCDKGEYSIHITLVNRLLEGTFIVR